MEYIKKYLIFKFDRKLLTIFKRCSNNIYDLLELILQVYGTNIFHKYFNAFCAKIAHNKKRQILLYLSYVNFELYKTKVSLPYFIKKDNLNLI